MTSEPAVPVYGGDAGGIGIESDILSPPKLNRNVRSMETEK